MKKKILVLGMSLMLMVAGLTACTGTAATPDLRVGVAYGMMYSSSAGKVTVIIDKNDKITDVTIKEYVPLSYIANTAHYSDVTVTDTVSITQGSRTTVYAKHIKVGDQVFSYDADAQGWLNTKWADGTTYACYPGNAPEGKKSAYEQADFCKWYIEQVTAGNYWVLPSATGTAYSIDFTGYGTSTSSPQTKTTKKSWADKALNGYDARGNGWTFNIQLICEAILENGLGAYTGEETTNSIGTVDTGSTLGAFHRYVGLAKEAFDNAKK